MAINSISGSALNGMQRGMQGIRRSAADIAQPITKTASAKDTLDFARSVVEMKQHEIQTKASARALQAHNDALGTLLDVEA